ncbi:AI-2E family transporter [Micromonospora inyonensis]|uniref:Predicted PurR-regulated permease PerM n=1 Tax=Micromonospora inyonensis TaxID=47866 RepID=A0A1C6S9Z4_9ACTN|nr:AI-2E family transporter [Micromonospora inyonensis]SCL26226.1 Predicted PurR-regulated permease PerM [Micromonospora inyonensis]
MTQAEDDPREPVAVTPTADPAPVRPPERGPRVRAAIRRVAIVAAQLLVIAAAIVGLGYLLGRLWVVLFPVVLGLLLTTVLWPAVRFLRAHRWPAALAAATVLLAFLALLVTIGVLVVPPVVGQVGELTEQATAGLEQVRQWLTGPPLNLGEDQIGETIDNVFAALQSNAQNIAGYVLTWATSVGSGIVNAVLALVLCFFFLKDGPRWVPWLAAQTGPRAGVHVAQLSERSWRTLSEFIRQQALVGFIDAFFIGVGLWFLGVPLVLPLAVLTFFAAFIPIIGAFVAGAFAVLIALVDRGPTTALIVLGIVLLVQQVEGNVLQPLLQGRGLSLHPAVVILAVAAGSSLAGITGAFLAVPVAAIVAVAYRYARDHLDHHRPDAPAATVPDE